MRRTWTFFAPYAVMFAALAAAPCLAGSNGQKNSDGQPDAKLAPTAQQIEELTKAIKDLKDTTKASVDKLSERVSSLEEKIEQEIRSLRATGRITDLNVATAQKDINDLRDLIAKLRQDMDGLRNRPTETRISGYAGTGSMMAATGRVRMVNTYYTPITVVLNGTTYYDLMPGQERYSSPLPAGVFTYEVLGISAPQQRALTAGETFTLTIYPR